VRQTSSREERDLLTTSDGVHGINGGDTSLDHFLRVDTLVWVDRLSRDIEEILSEYAWSLVDRLSGSVENTAEHVLAHRQFHDIACEFASGVSSIDSGCSFENLHDCLVLGNLENLSTTNGSITKSQVNDLGETGFLMKDYKSKSGVNIMKEKRKKGMIWALFEEIERDG